MVQVRRTCCFYKDLLFLQGHSVPTVAVFSSLCLNWEAERVQGEQELSGFLFLTSTTPASEVPCCKETWSLFVTSESGEISPEQNISSLTQKGDLEQVA